MAHTPQIGSTAMGPGSSCTAGVSRTRTPITGSYCGSSGSKTCRWIGGWVGRRWIGWMDRK
eukprot:scaffold13445_cov54-Phaeocystis_antarctica.AAC.1